MTLLDSIKLANDVVEKLRNVELKEIMANARLEAVNLTEEVVRLRQENLALREAAKLQDQMVPRDNVYWIKQKRGREDGPFCPTCWDGSRKPVRLIDEDEYRWICSVCTRLRWKPGGLEAYRESARNIAAARRRIGPRWRP